MNTNKIRVLIIDDSKVISSGIKTIIETHENIEVVGIACNGKEGYQEILRLKPSIILLDINMPVMDGLSLLLFLQKQKMHERVIVLSTLTSEGSRSTIRALNLGALDFLYKPEDSLNSIKDDLIEKIITINSLELFDPDEEDTIDTGSKDAEAKKEEEENFSKTSLYKDLKDIDPSKPENKRPFTSSYVPRPVPTQSSATLQRQKDKKLPKVPSDFVAPKIIAIGISTGGPKALNSIIPTIPRNFPLPILIVQHMPEIFTKQLADSIDHISEVEVREATDEEVTKAGTVYIAPGKKHMSVSFNGTGEVVIKTIPDNGTYTHTPSVDYFFNSIRNNIGSKAICAIMTGMGRDGAEAITKLHQKNALTIAQDESTSAVFGMPRVAIEMKGIDVVLKLEEIIPFILKALNYGK